MTETEPRLLIPRAYQLELFEESMRQNIIIAMETGSGKTLVAKLRIEAELERCAPSKIVWFLATTRILVQQQHLYLSSQLPAYRSRLITGSDGAEYWSSEVWRAIMPSTRLIVSTPQILFDALSHGHVSFSSIALLVFDEAHHCTFKHPTKRIMDAFYHSSPPGSRHGQLPHILGLTASPITSGKKGLLEKLESNLNAVCRAPSKHWNELQLHVNRPILSELAYDDDLILFSRELLKLDRAITEIDFGVDPFVKSLSPREGTEFLMSKKPAHILDQLQTLLRRASELHQQLGQWGSSFFMERYLMNLQHKISRWQGYDFSMVSDLPQGQESMYLHHLLSEILGTGASNLRKVDVFDVSPKAESLLKFLAGFSRANTRAIVFVKERSTAAALSKLISDHPLTRGLHSAAPIVGTSDGQGRHATFDMIEKSAQLNGLSEFRTGVKDVLVGTSVTEEGIDIPSANLVVRFDQPANFRAFIQSRGRARQFESRFVWMRGKHQSQDQYEQWLKTEAEMKEIYQDSERIVTEQDEAELAERNYEEILMSKHSGAQLSIQDAKQHLEHFCATLPKVPYVEAARPEYLLESPEAGYYRADVVLPQSISLTNHRIRGHLTWRSWKMAEKDAAFRAYTALQRAGLLNDHLLPAELPDPVGVECDISDQRVNLTLIRERLEPWRESVTPDQDFLLNVDVQWHDQSESFPLFIKVPWNVQESHNLELNWTLEAKIRVCVSPHRAMTSLRKQDLEGVGHACTQLLFDSVLLQRDKIRNQLRESPLMVLPSPEPSNLATWVRHLEQLLEQKQDHALRQGQTLLRMRGQTRYRRPFVYQSTVQRLRDCQRFPHAPGLLCSEKPEDHYEVRPVPNRLDYLIASALNFNTAVDYIPATDLEIDPLPVPYAKLMILVPSILHRLEIREVAASLRRDLLAPIELDNLDLVETAICAPSAHCGYDYNQLELLGDSILKLWTSCHLVARYPDWHEGYLSKAKSRIVSNAYLFRQAMAHGLDRYIHTEAFVSSRWKPPVAQRKRDDSTASKREVSSKLLSDVVEALIGASFLDSDEEERKTSKVKACLQLILNTIPWDSPAENAKLLRALAPDNASEFAHHEPLKEITGHSFGKKTLLKEAMTSPSHLLAGQGHYQRLEFLGDAILEFLVVERIGYKEKLSHVAMHRAKESVVNAHLLAFLCLGASVEAERVEVKAKAGKQTFSLHKANTLTRLWEFMRHCGSPDLLDAQRACVERYELLRESIQIKLDKGNEYPWYELLSLDAAKFFSDLIESTLGAIFVDSGGQMGPCRKFLRRLGLFEILDRVVWGELDAIHPKGRLGIISGTSTIKYVAGQEMSKQGLRHTSKVFLDEEEVASCPGQISKAAAEAKVAEEAARVVQERSGDDRIDVDIISCDS